MIQRKRVPAFVGHCVWFSVVLGLPVINRTNLSIADEPESLERKLKRITINESHWNDIPGVLTFNHDTAPKALKWRELPPPSDTEKEELEALLPILRDPDRTRDSKRTALVTLTKFNCYAEWAWNDIVPFLHDYHDKTDRSRMLAIIALCKLGCPEVVDEVVADLARFEADFGTADYRFDKVDMELFGLCQLGPKAKKAAKYLEAHLKTRSHGGPGTGMPLYLGRLDEKVFLTLLRIHSDDRKEQVRISRAALNLYIEDKDPSRRNEPFKALWMLQNDVPRFRSLLWDLAAPAKQPEPQGREYARGMAISMLGELGADAEPALPMLRKHISANSRDASSAEIAVQKIKEDIARRKPKEEILIGEPQQASAPIQDDRSGLTVSVKDDGRTLVVKNKAGKTIWEAAVINAPKAAAAGQPVIRRLSLNSGKIQVAYGEGAVAVFDVRTGKRLSAVGD